MKSLADLRTEIEAVQPWDAEERNMQTHMLSFLDTYTDCLHRTQLTGHFTASAWVLDLGTESVLLIHHQKLDRWLQPGGHADGEADLLAVAQREVLEETGLTTHALSNHIFDVDIHEIPARGHEPAHLHYDVRFLLCPAAGTDWTLNEEVKAAEWVPLHEVQHRCADRSILRMVDKTLDKWPQILDKRPM
jgi:8-oxo-dGTP pyrophosphatase MutT (NUDIX family)